MSKADIAVSTKDGYAISPEWFENTLPLYPKEYLACSKIELLDDKLFEL
jgi:hypothetical protein